MRWPGTTGNRDIALHNRAVRLVLSHEVVGAAVLNDAATRHSERSDESSVTARSDPSAVTSECRGVATAQG